MRLDLCTWQEVERYLAHSSIAIVPIGSTEQHGPNGLIGTDALSAWHIAHRVSDIVDAMVTPTINVGMAQHHLAFPGTITLRPSTLLAYLKDYIASLTAHGFDHLYFINGHGGNVATMTAAFSEVYAETSFARGESNSPTIKCAVKNWWSGERVRALSRELFPGREGSHATPSEISLTYHLYPEAVKEVAISPEIAPSGRIRDAKDYRAQFPDGRIGSDPSGATPQAGKRLFEAAVEDVVADFRSFAAS